MKQRIQTIHLKCGVEVTVDWNAKTKCKACGKDIWFGKTKTGKLMPFVLVGLAEWDTHFADCPKAEEFKIPKLF